MFNAEGTFKSADLNASIDRAYNILDSIRQFSSFYYVPLHCSMRWIKDGGVTASRRRMSITQLGEKSFLFNFTLSTAAATVYYYSCTRNTTLAENTNRQINLRNEILWRSRIVHFLLLSIIVLFFFYIIFIFFRFSTQTICRYITILFYFCDSPYMNIIPDCSYCRVLYILQCGGEDNVQYNNELYDSIMHYYFVSSLCKIL